MELSSKQYFLIQKPKNMGAFRISTVTKKPANSKESDILEVRLPRLINRS